MPSASQCARKIVGIIQEAGFEAYFAGGCVRDKLLGRTPKDFDIVASASPGEVKDLIPCTKSIGKAFGVVQACMGGHCFEIATFRQDYAYRDGRRPSSVSFSSAREDARRRDFTINAVFFDPVTKTYIDYADGLPDIENKIVRAVGDPEKRFREDHLRMLRAVRFSETLNFTLEPGTRRAIESNSSLIIRIAAERIRDELLRILTEAPKPGHALSALQQCRLLKQILRRTAESHSDEQLKKRARCLNRLAHEPGQVLLAALLLRTGTPEAEPVTKNRIALILETAGEEIDNLRLPGKTVRHIRKAIDLYWQTQLSGKSIPREILPELVGPEADTVLKLLRASGSKKTSSFRRLLKTTRMRLSERRITGVDLKNAGIKPGPTMKMILYEALILQAEGMDREAILKRIRQS